MPDSIAWQSIAPAAWMRRQGPDGVPRRKLPPRGIRDGRPGEPRTSSADDAANFGKYVVARNRLYFARPDLIATSYCLFSPESLDIVCLGEVKALDDLLRKQSSRRGRELHRFTGKLVHCE